MRRPTIFASSTCYDLQQVRADLKEFVESLGCEPILSEYDSFPVDPAMGTIENCLKAVESNADILVLIIGGSYGHKTEHGKSVTNLEYQTARAKGIPIYVFVVRRILDVLPVWKANRDGDFKDVVDSTSLFEFVTELRDSGQVWVFPFDTAQDICGTLRTQLAYLFADALNLRLRASGSGVLSEALHQLRGFPLRLVIERPPYWEYLLLGEVLKDELNRRFPARKDWEYGIALGAGPRMNFLQFNDWQLDKIEEAQRIIASLRAIFDKALPRALGKPGENGDAEVIVYVAGRIAAAYENLIEWKQDFRRVGVEEELERLRDLAGNLCDNPIGDIESFSRDLVEQVKEALAAPSTSEPRTLSITLKLTMSGVDEHSSELNRVRALYDAGQIE